MKDRGRSQREVFAARHGLEVDESLEATFNERLRATLLRHECFWSDLGPDKGRGICLCCMEIKAFSEFPEETPMRCAGCAKWVRKWRYAQNHEAKKIAMRARLYNIPPERYHELLEQQKGLCAICGQPETRTLKGKPKPLSIDHDHSTGSVRGLLCSACNYALGNFKDDVGILQKAIAYLEASR